MHNNKKEENKKVVNENKMETVDELCESRVGLYCKSVFV